MVFYDGKKLSVAVQEDGKYNVRDTTIWLCSDGSGAGSWLAATGEAAPAGPCPITTSSPIATSSEGMGVPGGPSVDPFGLMRTSGGLGVRTLARQLQNGLTSRSGY